MADLEQARAAKERLRMTLKGRPDVRGIGIARAADGYQLQVNVSRDSGPDLPGAPSREIFVAMRESSTRPAILAVRDALRDAFSRRHA
jgi:hypothetical protein